MVVSAGFVTNGTPSNPGFVQGPLSFIIYVILCRVIYMTILGPGIQLAWPGGTKLRGFAKLPPIFRSSAPRMADDPTFRLQCSIGGLIALAVWSAVITNWLAKQPLPLPHMSLYDPKYRDPTMFIAALIIGLFAGAAWVLAMRFARTPQLGLVVIAVSMSLAGTALFYYALDSDVRDGLLVLGLGIFLGELITVAMRPATLGEGLFAELLLAPEVPEDDAADANGEDPVPDDDPWRPQSRVWQGPAANASARAEPGGTARAGPSATLAADAPPAAPAAGTVTVPIRQPWTLMRPSAPPTRDTDDDGGSVTPPGGE